MDRPQVIRRIANSTNTTFPNTHSGTMIKDNNHSHLDYHHPHDNSMETTNRRSRAQRRRSSVITLEIKRGSIVIDTNVASSLGLLHPQRSSVIPFVMNDSSNDTIHRFVDYVITTLRNHFVSTGDGTDEQFRNAVVMQDNSSNDEDNTVTTTASSDSTYCYYQGLLLFYIYQASCFLYTLAGMSILYSSAALTEQWCSFWPWQMEGWCFILQGILSYMSDVRTLGRHSYWHCADRCFATFLFFVILTRIVLVIISQQQEHQHQRLDDYDSFYFKPIPHGIHFFWLFCFGLCLSVVCFVRSARMTRQKKPHQMMTAHIGWHFFAPVTAVILYLQIGLM